MDTTTKSIAIAALVIAIICFIWLILIWFARRSGNDSLISKIVGGGDLLGYPIQYFRNNMNDAEDKDDVALVLNLVRRKLSIHTTAGVLATIIASFNNWNKPPASIQYLPEVVNEYIESWGRDGINDALLQESKQLISDLSKNHKEVESERITSTRTSLHDIVMADRRNQRKR